MAKLTEIRWHGRGGQGAKTASLLLADAAFNTGLYVQGFPEYGPERMGAPITAYNRISDMPIRVHSNIYEPDFVVVVDDTLLKTVDVTAGLKADGAIVINTTKTIDEIKPLLNGYNGKVYAFAPASGPSVMDALNGKQRVLNIPAVSERQTRVLTVSSLILLSAVWLCFVS